MEENLIILWFVFWRTFVIGLVISIFIIAVSLCVNYEPEKINKTGLKNIVSECWECK